MMDGTKWLSAGSTNSYKYGEAKPETGSGFAIQIVEFSLVVAVIFFSYGLSGQLIYNNPFPFGAFDGLFSYTIMAGAGVTALGANKYFAFKERQFYQVLTNILLTIVLLNFLLIAYLYFTRSLRVSPYYFIVADVSQCFSLLMIKRYTTVYKRKLLAQKVWLIIGKENENSQLLEELVKRKNNQKTENLSGDSVGKLGFVPYTTEDLQSHVDGADYIYLTDNLPQKDKDQILSYCVRKNKNVYLVPETYEIALQNSEITQIGDMPIFEINSFKLTELQRFVKRCSDIFFALIGVILSSPIMIGAAIAIKLEDGGKVLYRQTRSGLYGREFQVIKFRSMVPDAEKNTGAVFATSKDTRITKVGKIIRSYRIDELPQFFNVLGGSMSLVGPRPERPVFVDKFAEEIPEYSNRLAVKPGITGLAQVMGRYTTTVENKIKFDLMYIRSYTLLLDFKILFKTVGVVLTKEQSEGFGDSGEKKGNPNSLQIEFEDIKNFLNQSLKNPHTNKKLPLFKGFMAVGFCLLLILGSVVLRYSAVAVGMMRAIQSEPEIVNTLSQPQPQSQIGEISQVEGWDGKSIDEEQSDQESRLTSQGEDADGGNAKNENENENENEIDQPTGVGQKSVEVKQGGYPAKSSTQAPSEEQNSEGFQGNEKTVLSEEKMKQSIEKLTVSEKMRIFYKFIVKIRAEDLIVLENLARGGFTREEKAQAKEIMNRCFDPGEVEQIKKIYFEVMGK